MKRHDSHFFSRKRNEMIQKPHAIGHCRDSLSPQLHYYDKKMRNTDKLKKNGRDQDFKSMQRTRCLKPES